MYGLMKAHVCSRHAEESQQRRLHYCGTCKTMGRLYGQKSRFLLNNDAVFLSELLTALSPESQPVGEWNRAYQSYNCFALPDDNNVMPLSLQVAATATLVMTDFKVEDQITDGGSGGWKMARRLFTAEFMDATKRMQAWGFPVEAMRQWGEVQENREQAAGEQGGEKRSGNQPALAVLASVSEPTAAVTGLVFRHSAATVGASQPTQESMYLLGFAFGTLIYTLDAYEDYAKDARRKDFNALQAAFQTQEAELPDCYESAALAHLNELRVGVERQLWALGLSQEQAQMFVTRLRSNLARRLGEPSPSGTCATPAPRLPFKSRWKSAVSLAHTLSAKHREQHSRSLSARLSLPFVFLSVLAIALVFPQQALAAASYRECRDIAFNLIFLSAALKQMLTAPMRLMPAFAASGSPAHGMFSKEVTPGDNSGGLTPSSTTSSSTKAVKVRRNRGGGGRGSGCDGCCECCNTVSCCGNECCCACECCECASGCGDCASCCG